MERERVCAFLLLRHAGHTIKLTNPLFLADGPGGSLEKTWALVYKIIDEEKKNQRERKRESSQCQCSPELGITSIHQVDPEREEKGILPALLGRVRNPER